MVSLSSMRPHLVDMVRRENIRSANTIWIFCEGEKTEKLYFQKLKTKERIWINVKVTSPGNTDAVGLVKQTLKYKEQFIDGDYVYCVFDRDRNTDQKLCEAKKLAERNGIKLIFSNPCFEYWILCHFERLSTRCELPEIKDKLNHYMTNYSKTDVRIYDKTESLLSVAIENAKRVNQTHSGRAELLSTESNPSTNVYEIIERFREIKKQQKTSE